MKRLNRLTFIIAIPLIAIAMLGVFVPQRSARLAKPSPGTSSVAEVCSPDRFPPGTPVEQCCQDKNRTWHTTDGGVVVFRTYGPPCREDDGVGTNCGMGSNPFKLCTYGPCGAKNEWVIEGESNIFHPYSKPKKCGWSVVNIYRVFPCNDPDGCLPPSGSRQFPEPYTDQEPYGGLIGTCPFRRCLNGGIPAE